MQQTTVILTMRGAVNDWRDIRVLAVLVKLKAAIGERTILCITPVLLSNGNCVVHPVRKLQRVLPRRGMMIDLKQAGFIEYTLLHQRVTSEQAVGHVDWNRRARSWR